MHDWLMSIWMALLGALAHWSHRGCIWKSLAFWSWGRGRQCRLCGLTKWGAAGARSAEGTKKRSFLAVPLDCWVGRSRYATGSSCAIRRCTINY